MEVSNGLVEFDNCHLAMLFFQLEVHMMLGYLVNDNAVKNTVAANF